MVLKVGTIKNDYVVIVPSK